MKNIFIICAVLLTSIVYGQRYGETVELSAGYVQDGFGINGAYSYFLSENEKLKGNMSFSSSTQKLDLADFKYNIIQLRAEYLHNIYASRREGFTLFGGGGILGGYEDISVRNSDPVIKSAINSKVIFGFVVTLEADIFIDRRSSVIGVINEQWHLNSDLGSFIPYVGVGYRYKL